MPRDEQVSGVSPAETQGAPQPPSGGRRKVGGRKPGADDFRAGQAPRRLAAIGHLPYLVSDPWRFLRSLPASGDLVTVRVGPQAVHVVCDAQLLHRILVDDRTFDKGGPLFDKAREVLGDGLPTCPHSMHRRLRRLVQPAFHPQRMPGYAELMSAQIGEALDAWRPGQVIDVPARMYAIAAGIATTTMFSTRIDPVAVAATQHSVQVAMSGIYRRLLTPAALERVPLPANRRYHLARNQLHDTVHGLVTRSRSGPHTDHGDLLSTLLAAGTGPNGLSSREVTDQVVSFFVSGVTSITSALSWALHLLAVHPQHAAALHREADEILGGRIATWEDVERLEWAGRFVTETMRLYPPGWIFTRRTSTATHLADRVLPAGSLLAFSPYLLHHRADLFAHPERFDPDRWLPKHAAQIPQHAYVPFGAGSRKCIAEAFTLMQATLVLSSIAARWRLHPVPGQRVRPAIRATLVPRRLHLRLEARHL